MAEAVKPENPETRERLLLSDLHHQLAEASDKMGVNSLRLAGDRELQAALGRLTMAIGE
jgi:hypothetical protein